MNDFDELLAFEAEAGSVKVALTAAELDLAGRNVDPEPTDAQKASGNYKKGHIPWKGLNITIETAAGGWRRGVGTDGKPWSIKLREAYGYIKKTESEADGDHLDVFISRDDLDSEIVFVINQVDPTTGRFDEHKIVLATTSAARAKEIYRRNYSEGWAGFDSIKAMTLDDFKDWIVSGDTSKRAADTTFTGECAATCDSK